ncbi:VanZ family protein [Hydrogenophaga sp. 5NK40-0174]|uniref:VanZ family protein n=1 Tax=Hydrogenophaga sp. 5NK40-0174 TaxID=3127649 RepID=UPI00310BF1EE
MKTDPWRLMFCGAVLMMAYQFSQWQTLREVYAQWDKPVHAIVFFAAWWLMRWCLPWRAWVVSLAALLGGAAVEVHQYFLPRSTPSLTDWLSDLVGVVAALAVYWGWQSAQRWNLQRRSQQAV